MKPLFEINYTQDDIDAVEKVIRRGSHWSKGPEIDNFESELSQYLNRKYCLVFNSGCSALFASLVVYDCRGKKVGVTDFTYRGVHHVIEQVGGTIGYMPMSKEISHMDLEDMDDGFIIENDIVVLTHIAGFPAMHSKRVRNLADRHGFVLIEDACQGFGASLDNEKVGSFGDVVILSFCQNKIVTSGEGGAVLTDDWRVYSQMKEIREYNMRMSSVQAALGYSQFVRIGSTIKERRRQAHILETKYPCALEKSIGSFETYQMYLVEQEMEIPDGYETKMRFDGCELLKEIPLSLSQEVAAP